ncbi:hypothetical protein SAMN05444374_11619 [Rhodococcoides kroppenstedtii]|uniref:Minor tail protein n=1 Tax=Rhodococcoides kroppenstedtii TaxID=293050 RepID=A0A1I0U9M6_9NOCA|nr:hypothetical protein [Rhodococcus kroppenstedtii]SFA60768.1 hypothetical protein SAMN05444374_11619 [Rhodococcus kroppenstedtii]
MPAEIGRLVDQYPWILYVIGAAVAYRYIGQTLAEGSTFWAKVLPGGQWFRNRAERRRVTEAADLADLKRQVTTLDRRVRALSETAALYDDYLEYDARWHRDHNIYSAEQGWDFPPPVHITFHEFMAARMPPRAPALADHEEPR